MSRTIRVVTAVAFALIGWALVIWWLSEQVAHT
jgi:hypothetical protein